MIGDVHGHLDDEDVAQLDAAGYDRVLFVGDLAGLRLESTLAVARTIARLETPVLLVPGNHDAPNAVQLLAEILDAPRLARLADVDTEGRVEALDRALGDATLCGWSRHALADDLDCIAGRPHSMGGPSLSFAPYLARAFGVSSLEDSSRRLRELVDASEAPNLLFFAHNGPSGLGDARDSIWGKDFDKLGGDFGDPDLADAVAYARSRGRRVVGVVAGHMHRRTRGGRRRESVVERDGTLYVNAAEVPRVWSEGGRPRRHHVRLTWDAGVLRAEEVIW